MAAKKLPKMGRHSSGQARVKLNGKTHYLGIYGTVEAQRSYTNLVEQWIKNGRQPLVDAVTVEQCVALRVLLEQFEAYLDESGRYRKNGQPTSQRGIVRKAITEFCERFGDIPAPKFSELLLLQHRDYLERRPNLSRVGINKKVAHLRAAFRWAFVRGLLTRDQWLGVKAIEPLRRAEVGHRDRKRAKRAVSIEDVERVADSLPRVPAAMLRLQALTGMRPGEVCSMRWSDIDRSPVLVEGVECWTYHVAEAKTDHHGHSTSYALGPRARMLLAAFVPESPSAYVFSPSATMRDLHAERRSARQTAPTRQTRMRDEAEGRRWSDRYGVTTYRQAIHRACRRANVERFTPHEVRHGFVTRAAERYGAFAASIAANHARVSTTEGYLHRNRADAFRVVVGMEGEATG